MPKEVMGLKIDKGLRGECEEIIQAETSRIQAIVDTIKGLLTNLSMTVGELQKMVGGHAEAVKQAYAQVHANYHNQFDASCFDGECDGDCVFFYAEQRFSAAMTKIIASITETRGTLTADEIEALARKHGVSYVH